jgi:RNA polymerase sigma factor (sigma-70 family)
MAMAQMDTVLRHLRRAVLRQDGTGWTDGQLLASFLDHKDEAAFEALVRRHGPMVFGVCRRVARNHHDAEDAFQATFLVLARKASSVRPRERVANWLHGVALRTALKAKTMTAKRRRQEKQVAVMPEPEAPQQDPWHDLQPLLDQELNGLPENYRLPILLCDLEGKTIKEATQQLGWPQGTLAGRLARGRKLLAKRLANRGVVLSAGLLAAVVSQNAASAAVPTSRLNSTVKAAALIAAGQTTVAGVVPVKVALLTEGVMKAMLLTKLKATVTVLLVLGIVTFGGVVLTPDGWGGSQLMANQPDSDAKKQPNPKNDGITKEAKNPIHPPAAQKESVRLPRGSAPVPVQALVSLNEGNLVVRTVGIDSVETVTGVVDGKKVTNYVAKVATTHYDLRDVKVRNVKGKHIDLDSLPKLLETETIALIAKDGIEVDPLYLRPYQGGTLLFFLPSPDPVIAVPPYEAAGQRKDKQRNKTVRDGSTPQEARPLKAAAKPEYAITSRLLAASARQPKEILQLPKVTVDDGQLVPVNIIDELPLDEKIKIGTFLDVRVKRLKGNKVRLFFSFQRNEVEKSSVSEIRVLGNSVQAIQDVELHKPVKIDLQKDAGGSAQRWVEITVDEIMVDEQTNPAVNSVTQQKKRKK